MRSFLAIAAASLALATAGPAGAQDMELRIGPDGVRPVIRDDDSYRYHHRPRYEERRYIARRGCNPDEAEYAARRFGLHHPRVVRVTPRSVTVSGFRRGGEDYIRFANVPGCPAIR